MSQRTVAASPPRSDDPIALPMQTRALPVGSIDQEARTVEVVFTTGAAVRRRRYTGWDTSVPFDEILEVSRSAINLSRLNAGGPVLDSHSAWRTSSQVGVIERAWIEGSEGRALIRFPSKGVDESADRMFAMVSEGIIRNVSVGYSIDEVRVEEPQKKGDVEKRIATRWTPFEVSFVTVPADAGAQVRGTEETFPVIVHRAAPEQLESVMEPETTVTESRVAPAAAAPVAVAAPAADAAAVRAAVEAERTRVAEINTIAARHAMPAEFVAQHISAGTDLAGVRAAVLDALAARSATTVVTARGVDARITHDEGDTLRAAIENAILHRANPGAVKLDDAAREWRGMSLMEMGRLFHEQTTGERLRGLGKMELATRLLNLHDDRLSARSGGMLSTSDFPAILANVVAKRLRSAYEIAPQHWKKLSRQNNAPDFKARAVTQLSNLPQLKPIKEGGEYQYASLGDGKESYALATFGRIVAITRQSLINDDLGAFDRLPMLLGRAAAETEASLFWAILTSNPAMADGNAIFHAAHNNLGTASAIAVASLNEARSAMRKQKGLAPKASEPADPLNLSPRFIVVSPDKETEVQQFLHTVMYPQQPSQVNVFAGSLEPIVEARLTGNAWYVFADPATIDTIEYAYLEGEQGLYTESRLGFEVDGIEIKGRLDFAAKAIDWRGMFKNPGA